MMVGSVIAFIIGVIIGGSTGFLVAAVMGVQDGN